MIFISKMSVCESYNGLTISKGMYIETDNNYYYIVDIKESGIDYKYKFKNQPHKPAKQGYAIKAAFNNLNVYKITKEKFDSI